MDKNILHNEAYPLISVVMPIYNMEKFLHMSVPSLMAQDYPNLEIILLNNDSIDGSQSIIDEYKGRDVRIKSYVISHVSTVKESRDNAISFANGEWVICVDADDAIEPNFVSKLWKRHVETDADCVCGKMLYRNEKMNILPFSIPDSDFDNTQIMNGTEAMLRTLPHYEIGLNSALWKKSIREIKMDKIYTDEAHGRVFLNNCDKVAFTDAAYYVTVQSQSVSRKITATSVMYQPIGMLGVYNYFLSKYGANSVLVYGMIMPIYRIYCQMVYQLVRFKLKSQLSEMHKEYLQEMYAVLCSKRNLIGLKRWIKTNILHLMIKIL